MDKNTVNRGDAYSKIANFFMSYEYDGSFVSINEIAKKIGVSESSLVRYCQKIGYKGFKDFSLDLANQSGITKAAGLGIDLPIEKTHDTEDMHGFLRNVFMINCYAILRTLDKINTNDFQNVLNFIKHAKFIFVMGYGNSFPIASDTCIRLARLGFVCACSTDPYSDALKLNTMTESDLLIAISYSGSSTSIVNGIKFVKERNAHVILITSSEESVASKYCDSTLIAAKGNLNDESVATRVAQLSLIDAIFARLVCDSDLGSYKEHVKRVDKYLIGMHSK